jgi:hypothetical protein
VRLRAFIEYLEAVSRDLELLSKAGSLLPWMLAEEDLAFRGVFALLRSQRLYGSSLRGLVIVSLVLALFSGARSC